MQSGIPVISVIILVYNKAYEMGLILAAFTRQNFDMSRVELILVDDGSTDGLDGVVERYRGRLRIEHVVLEHTGIRGANRNHGVSVAKAERLLFLDGDMIPSRDFLRLHEAATRENPEIVSMGQRFRLPRFVPGTIDERTILDDFEVIEEYPAERDERCLAHKLLTEAGESFGGQFIFLFSNNFCVWKRALETAGGFDGRFSRYWGAEDVELGYRLVRSGARLAFDPGICSYHVWHPEHMERKIKELEINYDLFLQKHPHWEVELFTREYRMGMPAYLEVQKRVRNGEHLVHEVRGAESLLREAPAGCLCIGIRDPGFVGHEKIAATLCTDPIGPEAKLLPMLGLRNPFREPFEGRRFLRAFVSSAYRVLGETFFGTVMEEASRVAAEVIEVEEGAPGRATRESSLAKPIVRPRRKQAHFLWRGLYEGSYGRHYLFQLAAALDGMGVQVGITVDGDFYNQVDRNCGFMGEQDPARLAVLARLFRHDLLLRDGEIPTILDSIDANMAGRSMGRRFVWKEFLFRNEESLVAAEGPGYCDHLLLRKRADAGRVPSAFKKSYLPVGVDASKLRAARGERRVLGRNRNFLWSSTSLFEGCGADSVVKAFKAAFPGDSDARLVILAGRTVHFREDYKMELEVYANGNQIRFWDRTVERIRLMEAGYAEKLRTEIGADERIEFRFGNLGSEQIFRHLLQADCLLELSADLTLSPLALQAHGLGIPVLCLDNGKYAGYFPQGSTHTIACKWKTAFELGPFLESTDAGQRLDLRHCLYPSFETSVLSESLRALGSRRRDAGENDKSREEFLREFDWTEIAARMLEITG